MDILSEHEQLAVQQFNENKVLKEAVRKVLLAGIYENGVISPGVEHDPTKNFALSTVFYSLIHGAPITNEELGQVLRGQASGIRLLEQAFAELEKYKPKKSTPPKKENPGV